MAPRPQGYDPNQTQLPGFESAAPARAATNPLAGGSLNVGRINTDLKTLHDRLGSVIEDVDKLSTAIKGLATNVGKATVMHKGGVGNTASATGLTVSGFSNPPTAQTTAARTPQAPATGGGAPNRNTTAPVSFGASARMIAGSAAAEVGAGIAGTINTTTARFAAGGMPMDLMARQANAIFGLSNQSSASVRNTTSGFTGFMNAGQGDLTQAMAALQANPMLFGSLRRGSQQQTRMQGFMNTLQRLNPLMTATGAAQTANQLASGPALQALQRFGSRNGQMGQGLINPQTMGVNSTQRIFSEMLQTVMGGRQLTSSQMRAMSGNTAQATREWTMIGQNNNIPGMGLGLSPQMLTELRQFAASGGNLQAAQNALGRSGAGAALRRSTATTAAQQKAYENVVGTLNDLNDAVAAVTNRFNQLQNSTGIQWLENLGVGGSSAVSGVAHGVEAIGRGALLAQGAKSLYKGGRKVATRVRGRGGTTPAEKTPSIEDQYAPTKADKMLQQMFKRWGARGTGLPGEEIKNAGKPGEVGTPGEPGYVPDVPPDIVPLGDPATGATSTQGMTPTMSSRMHAMMRANPSIRITSGHRTTQQQKNLFMLKGGKGVAEPGKSAHQTGKAADLGPPSQFAWIAKNARKFGLYTPAPKSEPWHVQTMGDPSSGVTGAQIVSGASGQLGTPYVWGGETAGKAFDCSGLVQYVFAQVGINLPRTSQAQAAAGKPVNGIAQAQAGDLILYNYGSTNDHVAIYIGGGKQIAAPHTGTVVQIQSVDTAHISTIRRVVGGGAGQAVVAAAQGSVGQQASDTHASGATSSGSGSLAAGSGLANTFLSMVSGLGGMQGTPGPTGGGGGSSSGTAPSNAAAAGSSSTTVSVPASGTMSPAQVQAAWIAGGGPANVAKTMAGIAMAESSDQPGIVQKGEPPGLTGYGLWQITPTSGITQNGTFGNLLDPVNNAKAAVSLYKSGGNTLRAWSGDHYLTQNNISPTSSGIGDPLMMMGDPATGGVGSVGGGLAGFSVGGSGAGHGHGNIYVNMPIQMTNGSSADASKFANQIIDAIERRTGMSTVQST